MKKLLAVTMALGALIAPTAALAGEYSQSGGTRQRTCYKEVYREEYIPGTKRNPGRVRRWSERKKVPCEGGQRNWMEPTPHIDDNSCIEGAILGGIAGGGLGAALSRDEGNLIGIPLGIVGGSLIGCQIDGG